MSAAVGRNTRPYASAIGVAAAPISFGFSMGFTSPVLAPMLADGELGLSAADAAMFVSLVNIGAAGTLCRSCHSLATYRAIAIGLQPDGRS